MSTATTTARMPRALRRTALAIAAAGLAAGLLTACAGNPVEDLVQNGVEDAIKSATGEDVSIGGELPTDFPTSIDVVDGKITVGIGTGDSNGWVVVVQADEADAAAGAKSKLEAGGFVEDTSLTQEQIDSLTGGQLDATVYADDEYRVLLAVKDDTVTYTVTPK
ncbi:hypothetical protein [Agromyces sp. Marseille-Q5079]|uniref:hypothetical protein n=1 Tax=Agromyces sp. Marseille-Q5079 TaxID=3439059 RepID=UPI003D9CAAC7